ncbi:unnamed protein product [Psylliodes chrysocephalus]|uniref:ZSWIM3 N-terminal domain-containing protein n=1 Tax=Psylliodes chrysocephalus TaxID=3402493 RepID=A0A9P0CVW0_9CUCU|nr:unnamed protein product [Psylliodes chrysocephala]
MIMGSTYDLKENYAFSSYEELNKAITLYEKQNRVQFWKRDCKTLDNAKNHCPKLYSKGKAALKYIIKYCCIHGGQSFRPKQPLSVTKRRLRDRKYLGHELFCDSIFNSRWTREYIKYFYSGSLQNSRTETELEQLTTLISYSSNTRQKKILNSHEKFKKAQSICLNLSTMCSEVSTSEFNERMSILLQLQRCWQNLEKVQIINSENAQNSNNLDLNERFSEHNVYSNNSVVQQDCQNISLLL